jgi:hypothetical protein
MVEVTESQGKDMRKIGDVEDRKVAAIGEMAASQLVYFEVRDKEISANQRGLIEAVHNLSNVLGRAFTSRVILVPPRAGTEPPLFVPPSPHWAPIAVDVHDCIPAWAASCCKPLQDSTDGSPVGNSFLLDEGSLVPQ